MIPKSQPLSLPCRNQVAIPHSLPPLISFPGDDIASPQFLLHGPPPPFQKKKTCCALCSVMFPSPIIKHPSAPATCSFAHPNSQSPTHNLCQCRNQVAILHSLPLLTSFLGVKGLPAADTLAALFVRNLPHAQKQGPALITRLVKLVVSKGRRSSARLLTLLGTLLVVGGLPLKLNQDLVRDLGW